jgi:hypothetical protein
MLSPEHMSMNTWDWKVLLLLCHLERDQMVTWRKWVGSLLRTPVMQRWFSDPFGFAELFMGFQNMDTLLPQLGQGKDANVPILTSIEPSNMWALSGVVHWWLSKCVPCTSWIDSI